MQIDASFSAAPGAAPGALSQRTHPLAQDLKPVASADPPAQSDSARAVNASPLLNGTNVQVLQEGGLSAEDQAVLDQLRERDREVRDHEEAHARVGGEYAGSPSYDYETGPDNRQYAVGGEVSIDVSPVDGDPQATIEKMIVVKAAALAPAEPSSQDRAVAARADAIRLQAQADLIATRNKTEDTGLPDEIKAFTAPLNATSANTVGGEISVTA